MTPTRVVASFKIKSDRLIYKRNLKKIIIIKNRFLGEISDVLLYKKKKMMFLVTISYSKLYV